MEGLRRVETDGTLDPLQTAFSAQHALRCGFCTPGFPMLARHALDHDPGIAGDDARLTRLLSSNLCRCTGYDGIRRAVRRAAAESGDGAVRYRSVARVDD